MGSPSFLCCGPQDLNQYESDPYGSFSRQLASAIFLGQAEILICNAKRYCEALRPSFDLVSGVLDAIACKSHCINFGCVMLIRIYKLGHAQARSRQCKLENA